MKKCVVALFCLLLTATLTVSVFAAKSAKMTINAEQTTAKPGDTVSFSVTLEKVEDCRSAGFKLSYDEAVFEFLDGSCSLKDTIISSLKDGTGVFTYGDPVPVSGEIFEFRLKVKQGVAAGNYHITAKGSVRNTDGAVATKVSGVTVAVTEGTTATTQPAVAETVPVKQTGPAEPEATIPENATEPVPKETKPAMDTPMAPPETAVHTIGAAPEAQRAGFPWWTLAVAVVILAAGGAALYKRRK